MWDGSIPPLLLNASLVTVLLVFSAFTLTYKDVVWAKLARVAVAPFIISALFHVGWDATRTKYSNPLVPAQINAFFMIIRVIDICIVSLYDAFPPRWVSHRSGNKLPLPTSLAGRLLYTFDLLVAVRGTSFIPDRHWDFATSHIAKYRSPYSSRWSFIWSAILRATGFYLALDVSDTLVKRYVTFNPASPNPIFELPFAVQCFCGFHMALVALCSVSIVHITIAIVFIGTGLTSDLDLWPPFFNRPFLSPSLSYFWSHGWHLMLRRDFLRVSTLLMGPLNRKTSIDKSNAYNPPSYRFGTVIISFMVSALIHTIIKLNICHGYDNPEYLTSLTVFQRYPEFFFFAVQPVGIAIDRLIVRFGDSEVVRVSRRLWVWVFLLWTSRWIADGYSRTAFWYTREAFPPVSPIRGVLFGDWTGKKV